MGEKQSYATKIRTAVARAIAGLTFVCLSISARAQGNFIVNGGFDTSSVGWNANGIGPEGGYQSSGGNPGGYFLLSGPTTASVSHDVKVITGADYIVEGEYCSFGNSSVNPNFAVSVNNSLQFQIALPADSAWHRFSFVYNAANVVQQIPLTLSTGLSGTGGYVGVDNITMQLAPEPSTTVLFLAATSVACCYRKFRMNGRVA